MTTTPKTTAPLTLVTAYFEVKDTLRNRTPRHYHAKMAKLLPFVKWPMVVFCEAPWVDTIKNLRGDKPTVIYATRWEEFSVYRHRDILHAHTAQRQPQYNADLSLIFHEKANFVRRVIDENPYQSDMFLWCDIGLMKVTWRECRYMPRVLRLSEQIEWPNLQVCRAFGDQVAFFGRHLSPPPPRKLFRSGFGAEFGAAKPSQRGDFVMPIMISWMRMFANTLTQFAKASRFPAGKDSVLRKPYFAASTLTPPRANRSACACSWTPTAIGFAN